MCLCVINRILDPTVELIYFELPQSALKQKFLKAGVDNTALKISIFFTRLANERNFLEIQS